MCLLWKPWLMALHVVSDSSIAVAYFSIPFALLYFVRKRRDVDFRPLAIMFAAFILLCGATHLMAVLTLWVPVYVVDGLIKLATALVSIATAVVLWRLLPTALKLPSPTALQVANEALRQSNRRLESFAYSLSHDLQTPLRGINGFSQVLLEDYGNVLDERGRGYLARVRRSAERMGRTIDDMAALASMNQRELRHEMVDLSAMAREILEELKQASPERQVEPAIAAGCVVQGDGTLLWILMQNLLGNAWKFSRGTATAKISFECHAGDSETVFVVRDNGVGFDMRYADKLFQPFERLHNIEEYEGTGLGLASVRRIVDLHGGRVWAEGEPGRGAAVFFTVPRPAPPGA
jgi:light-regulated signal transduction histidine kinase (bacteriophytochrome)